MNVLITGAAGGLGRALSCECARRGYRLFLTDVNGPGLSCICEGIRRQFDAAVDGAVCDLTDGRDVDAMFSQIDEKGVRFDMLFDVAGVDFEGGFLQQDREKIAGIVALNDAAALRVAHAALRRRRTGGRFTLVFVSSLASLFPMPLKVTYAASKRFLLDFATALRRELWDENVRVMALCPGGMATAPQAVQAMQAQGIWGELTANPLETVARRTVSRALRGQALYVPGALNRALAWLGRLLPRSWVAAAIYKRWQGAQGRSLPQENPEGACPS